MKIVEPPKEKSEFELAIDQYLDKSGIKPCECEYKPIKGTERRSEYEPEHVSWREQCQVCKQIRFCSTRRPVPKTELIVDNT